MDSDLIRLSSQNVSVKEKTKILHDNWDIQITCMFPLAHCLVIWPNGSSIISGHQDGSIRSNSYINSFQQRLIGSHFNRVNTLLLFNENFLVSCGMDGKLKLWDLYNSKELFSIAAPFLESLSISPDPSTFYTGDNSGTIKQWNLQGKPFPFITQPDSQPITALQLRPNTNSLITGNFIGVLNEYQPGNSKILNSVKVSDSRITYICCFGLFIAVSSWDLTIAILNNDDFEIKTNLSGHSDTITGISHNSFYLISASDDKTIRLWDSINLNQVHVIYANERVKSMSTINNLIAFTGGNKIFRLWDTETKKFMQILTGHRGNIKKIVLSKDFRFMVTGGGDNSIRIWDLIEKRQVVALFGHKSLVRFVAISEDNLKVVSLGDESTMKIWDLQNEEEVFSVGVEKISRSVNNALAINQNYIFIVMHTLKFQVWALNSAEKISEFSRKYILLRNLKSKIRLI